MIKTYAEFMDAIDRNHKRFSLVPTELLNDAGVEMYHLYCRLSWDIAFCCTAKEMLDTIVADDTYRSLKTKCARAELRMIIKRLQLMIDWVGGEQCEENVGEDYIPIKEFAEAAGITHQSVYKRLNKQEDPLKRYLKTIRGKRYLDRSALFEIYGIC